MARPIACLGIRAQRAFAGCMNRWTGKLSLKRRKAAQVVFCLLGGGCSAYGVLAALLGAPGSPAPLEVHRTQAPSYATKSRATAPLPYASAEARVGRRTVAFHRYWDSLRRAGADPYDSLLSNRPASLDSVRQTEERYQVQPLK
jgi:hypothetical protein